MLVSALMSISLFVVARQSDREGLHLWGVAMALISMAWILVYGRGSIPIMVSVILANTLFSAAISLKLAAVYEYRYLNWPRWQCLAPILATLIIFTILPLKHGLRAHILANSVIYASQLIMLAIALYGDKASRSGHAWWLIFGVTIAMIPMMIFRGLAAGLGHLEFATVQSDVAPNTVQLATYIFVMSTITLGSLGFILMIKERADRKAQHLALTDSLTGALNRRAFMSRAAQELAFSQRQKLHMALIILDVDHFKSINDRYGHIAGDAVLIDLIKTLVTRLRTQDIIGRYGGEEFCILLPGTDDAGAHAVATSLLQAVETATLATTHGEISITISLGISVFDPLSVQGVPDFSALLESADSALYQAKHQGRNRAIQSQMLFPNYAPSKEVSGG